MNVKVNCSILAAAEMELQAFSSQLQTIADELRSVQASLLRTGDTFREEAWLTGNRREAIEREKLGIGSFADTLARLVELYSACEHQQRNAEQTWGAAKSVSAELMRSNEGGQAYIQPEFILPEELTELYHKQIKPLMVGLTKKEEKSWHEI